MAERLMRHIEVNENDCWMWQGAKSGSGYGIISVGGRAGGPKLAHRHAYMEFVGPIPKNHQIDHLCYDSEGYSNKLCINPEHLEPVLQGENMLRGYAKRKAAGWKHYTQKRKDQGEVE